MKSIRIVGAGLMGTSIGLALKSHGVEIQMVDSDPRRQKLAQDLVGRPPTLPPELVILAMSLASLPVVIAEEYALNPTAAFMDIGSVKTKPQQEVEELQGMSARFCGTHPMAGREVAGPEAARADLFDGRAWILTPSQTTQSDVLAKVTHIVTWLNAVPILMGVQEHDRAVALISHLPQISASLLAKQLNMGAENSLALAASGLMDSTRIAGSDPELWREIIFQNREEIRPILQRLHGDMGEMIASLDKPAAIEKMISDGKAGRERIPGKHGSGHRNYAYLPIVIEDKAGQLAALFAECATAGVNIEDLSIEHSPGQFTGLITLALAPDDVGTLSNHLLNHGWNVHAPRA